MGSLIYAAWWLVNRPTAFDYDVLALCLLLSLDSSTWLRWAIWRRGS